MMNESLIKFITEKMKEKGNTLIDISNIRLGENDNVFFADISYIWYLNGWEKHAEHKDMIFVYADNQWHTPMFFS